MFCIGQTERLLRGMSYLLLKRHMNVTYNLIEKHDRVKEVQAGY